MRACVELSTSRRINAAQRMWRRVAISNEITDLAALMCLQIELALCDVSGSW